LPDNIRTRHFIFDFSSACQTRLGGPFSHPSGSSAQDSLFFLLKACLCLSLCLLFPAPNPVVPSPENVQYRAVFIQFLESCGSPGPVSRPPASNPCLTRGAVESPAKFFPAVALFMEGARPLPISPEGSKPTLSPGWRPRSKIHHFMGSPARWGKTLPGS